MFWSVPGQGPGGGLVCSRTRAGRWSGLVWSWTRAGGWSGLVQDQGWEKVRSGPGPGFVGGLVQGWEVVCSRKSTWRWSVPGPGLGGALVWSGPGLGGGLVQDQGWQVVWSFPGLGGGLVQDQGWEVVWSGLVQGWEVVWSGPGLREGLVWSKARDGRG